VLLREHFVDERVWDAAQAETAAEEGAVGFHVCDGFAGGGEYFVDFMASGCGCEGAG